MNFYEDSRLTPALGMLGREEELRRVWVREEEQQHREGMCPDLTMNREHTGYLLAGLPLAGVDAARLVLEAVEEMPELREEAASATGGDGGGARAGEDGDVRARGGGESGAARGIKEFLGAGGSRSRK